MLKRERGSKAQPSPESLNPETPTTPFRPEFGSLTETVTNRQAASITSLVVAGYIVILGAVFGLGIHVTVAAHGMRGITENIFLHPFTVTTAIAEVKSSLLHLRYLTLETILMKNARRQPADVQTEIDTLADTVRSDIEILRLNFLGDKTKLDELEQFFEQGQKARVQILRDVAVGNISSAEALSRDTSGPIFDQTMERVNYVQNYAQNRARRFVMEAQDTSGKWTMRTYIAIVVILVFIIFVDIALIRRIYSLQDNLRYQALFDFLTRVPNRRYFVQLAQRELVRARRHASPTCFVAVDLDKFKDINDCHGHHVGDRVLVSFCDTVMQNLRASDLLGRLGGEEFGIMLPDTPLGDAREVAERVRQAVSARLVTEGVDAPIHFTASFGVAAVSSTEETLETLFQNADSALYEAKRSGRNKVCVYRHTPQAPASHAEKRLSVNERSELPNHSGFSQPISCL